MANDETKQYIVINLNNDMYGIDIKYVDNIITMQSITRVPKSQSYFAGVINLRGEIVPVLSLRKKLGMEADKITPNTRIVIVRPEAQASTAGIIVDEVKEVIKLNNSDIDKITYNEYEEISNYSIGVGKYEEELINLLNIPGIVINKETNS